ncbi:MAG: type II toxin-antitoxin system VapC family toxin [Gemmataceae bacterium]|nr:type II toxin-antitoxin system VapC family toxin [Gemmataceae bacterium]
MRLLLDTHTLIWSIDHPAKVSATAMALLRPLANDVLLSAVTVGEIAIKVGLGKLALSSPFRAWIDTAVADLKLTPLPITLDRAERYVGLPHHHRDPFDRLLAAQALADGLTLVSADSAFDPYGVARVW